MYANLKAELAHRKITAQDLATVLGISRPAVCLKLNGRRVLTFGEALKIKQFLKADAPDAPDAPMEELFQNV